MKRKNEMSIEQDNKMKCSTSILLILKNILKRFSKFAFLLIVFLFLNIGSKYPALSESSNISVLNTTNTTNIDSSEFPKLIRSRLSKNLVKEVDEYMNRICPGNKINSELFVNLCIKYDIDITFALAQGILESHLGTRGKAAITNSVWNVGTYDNGKIGYIYKDPNESIEPYLILLREKYLVNNKKVYDLLKDGKFINVNGYRYASVSHYESKLRNYVFYINMNTSISMYERIIKLPDEKIIEYFSYEDKQNQELLAIK